MKNSLGIISIVIIKDQMNTSAQQSWTMENKNENIPLLNLGRLSHYLRL